MAPEWLIAAGILAFGFVLAAVMAYL